VFILIIIFCSSFLCKEKQSNSLSDFLDGIEDNVLELEKSIKSFSGEDLSSTSAEYSDGCSINAGNFPCVTGFGNSTQCLNEGEGEGEKLDLDRSIILFASNVDRKNSDVEKVIKYTSFADDLFVNSDEKLKWQYFGSTTGVTRVSE
jgi:hypothetical protein